jgi:hypothetical protein
LQAALRVGVLLERAAIAAWQHRCLAELNFGPAARVVAVAWLRGAPLPLAGGLALRAYERVDRAVFQTPRDPLAPADASELLAGVPAIEAAAVPRADGFALAPEAIAALRAQELDVLLQLGGGGPLVGDVLDVARLGLWSFAHEDLERRRIPPFFAEMVSGEPVSEARLVARSGAGERVLLRAVGSTNPNSLHRNRVGALWKSALLPSRAIGAFAAGHEPVCDGDAADAAPTGRAPGGALALARLGASIAARVVRNRAKLRHADRVWFVALRRCTGRPIASDPLAGFVPVPMPPDRFYADPVLVRAGDQHHLFFEDADRATGLGAISWCAIHPDGTTGPVRRILEGDTHHSYPFVFAWRGSFYMIPETSEKRTVELYRAVDFPLRWQLEKVIFQDVAAVDTTVFEQDGRLWLFSAMSPSGGALNDELFLFHADDIGGEWRAHPGNPIVSDVRRARPAGPLFRDDGVLVRPGQDCAGDYGAAFWLNRVDRLDEREYRETPIRRIDPSWHPDGVNTHTFTRAGDFEAMDNRLWMPR